MGWDDPAPPVAEVRHTSEQRRVLAVLRKTVGGKNPDRPIPGTEIGTESRNEKTFRSGRPKKEGSLSASERKARWKAKQKKPSRN